MWWLFGKNNKHLPESTGTFVPGCMDVMLDYEKNGIFMRLYYPTDEKKAGAASERWCRWLPGDNYVIGIAKLLMTFVLLIRVAYWWSDALVPVLYGSRIKVGKEKLKCIILSHGLGGFRGLYSNMCCELASRGFLVIALEHRDGSACHTFYYQSKEDARNRRQSSIEYQAFALGKNHLKQRKEQVLYRSIECSKALDFVINLNNGQIPLNVIGEVPTRRQIEFQLSDLVGRIDLDSITVAGHSFGGATALLTLSKRQELRQGILLDPWMFPIKDDNLHEKLRQPLLFINTQTFHITSNVNAMSKFLTDTESRKMYTILHTTHENQTDSVLLFGYWLNWFMKKIKPLTALQINNSLILEFLEKFVGCPCDIEDCQNLLEEQKNNIESGLTKPWA